ncbi:aminotransferase class III-fold pyridoxal phosphate-dependent enzyme [Flagellimonas allohymeniacidonis]|uniref:Aminotransferase class III-fold pyridoxal phosphate-dependent enzyme n=1 Tax=Flagellimonas allohymeniacidonis TaxID=2517819 RepID=A0A4V2HSG4_9FLAO|nr:aminotransferase class III-fold pyridoxal phosphate-dependent enzyme [Allomuricauda hymeniacidonis]TAI47610.1 aminotransferase class III-fold pyridoxal phosphate-dependent enzyme [Allomuricauda hymeniacidonis]
MASFSCAFIEKEFGIKILDEKRLDGYDNSNYRISTAESNFIYKTYNYSESLRDIVLAENEVLLYLQDEFDSQIPKPIPFKDQSHVKTVVTDNQKALCRMLSFLDGRFLGDVEHTNALFESLGTFLAKLDLKLKNLNNYAIQAREWEWDIQYLDLNKKYINDIPNPKDRKVVHYFFGQFEEIVRPVIPVLRKQIIHNDANEWNVLVKDEEISGIIDFGDLAHTFLINELAIAITYACYDKENPLDWAPVIVKAYHKILPLEEKELRILYYLIAARLCTSVCNSAYARKADPNNAYASVSEKSAWKMIHRWLAINPLKAENEFRKAANFPPLEPTSFDQVIKKRLKHISPILSLSYKEPIHMVRSAFQYMYDASGNTFLDAYNNIPHVGHSHPKVVNAGKKQMAKLNTNTRYLYEELAAYAEKLLGYFPPPLNKVLFVNSGSAASDLAIRMANNHTESTHIMVMELGYHGNTQTSIDISDYKFSNPKGQGQKQHIIKTPLPDTYRGKYEKNNPNAGKLYGTDAVTQIKNCGVPISAFISEPVVGCAGQIPLAKGYLREVYPAIKAQGGVCISDEVQTGFGRLGEYFWGFEAHGVVPDMVILGKPIANGHPMGAVVCTDQIASSFERGVEFFSSFGGNPVSCSIASAVLDVIEEEKLQENAKKVGNHYMALLKNLMPKYPCIGDVRGSGLFIGCEIVKDDSKIPDTALANHIKNELRRRHILVSTDGPFDNVIKTKPALCFSKENAETVVKAIDEILKTHYNNV